MKRFSEVLSEYRNRAGSDQGQNSQVQDSYDPMPAQYPGNQGQQWPSRVSQPSKRPAVYWTNGR